MSLPAWLFLIRVLGAALLLLFVGLIAWYLARDLQATRSKALASDRPQGKLRVVETAAQSLAVGAQFDVLSTTLIGRSHRCGVILDEPYVSAEHARLFRRDKRWWVEDLASRNGTLLNDVEVREPTVITQGDVVTVGSTKLEIDLA